MASMMEKLEEIDIAEKEYMYDEGMAKGIKKGKIDVAKKMQKNGMSPQQISMLTGLTIKQLKSLRKKSLRKM